MKVSQKTEYGIRAMIALAREFDATVSLRDLAKQETIPEAFLEQIMGNLRRAGLIRSTRGARGGYRLAGLPGQISIGDVVATLEGSLSPARCGDDCQKRLAGCSTRTVMDRIEESITETLDGIYLNDLLEEETREQHLL